MNEHKKPSVYKGDTSKYRKISFLIVIIFAVGISSLLALIYGTSDRYDAEIKKDDDQEEVVMDNEDSDIIQEANSDETSPNENDEVLAEADGYVFVNEEILTKNPLTSHMYYQEDCLSEGMVNFEITSSYFSYTNPTSSVHFNNRILHNPATNLGKDSDYDKAYSNLTDFFASYKLETNYDSFFRDMKFLSGKTCAMSSLRSYPRLPVNYKGIDNAFLFLNYGDTQSTVGKGFFPAQFTIISRINTDISLISISPFTLWDLLIENNTLTDCETEGEIYIEIFNEPGKSCVENVINTQLDQSKVDAIVNEALEIYKIKE
jgi:hypothetical protein